MCLACAEVWCNPDIARHGDEERLTCPRCGTVGKVTLRFARVSWVDPDSFVPEPLDSAPKPDPREPGAAERKREAKPKPPAPQLTFDL